MERRWNAFTSEGAPESDSGASTARENKMAGTTRSGKTGRRLIALAAGAAAAATGIAVAAAAPASGLPASQSICALGNLAISPANGFFPLTSPRSVSVGGAGTTIKASLVSDVGVDSGAEVRLGWAVNNAFPREGVFGPANFANHAEFFESRSTFGLINVGAGVTTIQPFVRVSGSGDKRANLLHTCFTIEAFTS